MIPLIVAQTPSPIDSQGTLYALLARSVKGGVRATLCATRTFLEHLQETAMLPFLAL